MVTKIKQVEIQTCLFTLHTFDCLVFKHSWDVQQTVRKKVFLEEIFLFLCAISIFYETPFILEKKHFGVKVVQRKVYIKFLLLALAEIAKVYSHQFIVDPSITVCGDAPKYAMKAFRFS